MRCEGYVNSQKIKSSSLLAVDSFKRSSKIKYYLQFEVDFLLFYAQNERKLSEFKLGNVVRGVRFEPSCKWKHPQQTLRK